MTVEEYNQSVDLYADGIYRFIVKNIHDSNSAQDIVQDTFEKTWINKTNINGQKIKTYLFTTAYHSIIDYLRKTKRMELREDITAIAQTYCDSYTGLQEVLHEAVDKLTPVQRSVVMLRDYEGYSYQEIADITLLNESQVKVYIYRARMFLKNYIGDIDTVI